MHLCLLDNSPQGKGHRLPSLFPLWSGCESPGFLQKIPCWASADHCNRSCHTLTAAGKVAHQHWITSFLNNLWPFWKWFYKSPYSCSRANLFWRCGCSMWIFLLTLRYWIFFQGENLRPSFAQKGNGKVQSALLPPRGQTILVNIRFIMILWSNYTKQQFVN